MNAIQAVANSDALVSKRQLEATAKEIHLDRINAFWDLPFVSAYSAQLRKVCNGMIGVQQ
jgi:hypothetical protein